MADQKRGRATAVYSELNIGIARARTLLWRNFAWVSVWYWGGFVGVAATLITKVQVPKSWEFDGISGGSWSGI